MSFPYSSFETSPYQETEDYTAHFIRKTLHLNKKGSPEKGWSIFTHINTENTEEFWKIFHPYIMMMKCNAKLKNNTDENYTEFTLYWTPEQCKTEKLQQFLYKLEAFLNHKKTEHTPEKKECFPLPTSNYFKVKCLDLQSNLLHGKGFSDYNPLHQQGPFLDQTLKLPFKKEEKTNIPFHWIFSKDLFKETEKDYRLIDEKFKKDFEKIFTLFKINYSTTEKEFIIDKTIFNTKISPIWFYIRDYYRTYTLGSELRSLGYNRKKFILKPRKSDFYCTRILIEKNHALEEFLRNSGLTYIDHEDSLEIYYAGSLHKDDLLKIPTETEFF